MGKTYVVNNRGLVEEHLKLKCTGFKVIKETEKTAQINYWNCYNHDNGVKTVKKEVLEFLQNSDLAIEAVNNNSTQ